MQLSCNKEIPRLHVRGACLLVLLLAALPAAAQTKAYFVTYDHHLEEPGNLELGLFHAIGAPRAGQTGYWASIAEFEYGVTGWWTSELYLEGQSRPNDSTIFTGWRWENRFRPLRGEHRVNPVLYFEFEDVNEGSLIQKEVVGHAPELDESNAELRAEKERELEMKLILSSQVHDWNMAENFIVEKNFSEDEGWEFGYALGVSRPLATLASPEPCRFCRENFIAGLELYGGLGSTRAFGFRDTAHYLAPELSWQVSDNAAVKLSAGFGLTHDSAPVLFRFGYTYEIHGFGRKVSGWFGGGK
jgi:hypothetical protein